MRDHNYHVYILRCSDGSYYVGMTGDIGCRLQQHQNGTFPTCYTFRRRPLELVYSSWFTDIFQAIACEKRLKGWSRKKKEALIRGEEHLLPMLSRSMYAKRIDHFIALHRRGFAALSLTNGSVSPNAKRSLSP